MTKARIALFIGILCISIFPVIVRMNLTSGLISAFYRMAIATAILLPVALYKGKLGLENRKLILPIAICGILFASDIAVWNISIQHSSATQATLLTNLSPIWVGVFSFVFLNYRPRKSFWLGTLIALMGMMVFVGVDTILELKLDTAFFLGVLSGLLYALYILVSKTVLEKVEVITFITYSMIFSTVFLFIVNIAFGEEFFGFSGQAWISLFVQGIVCQLIAWLLISYSTQNMRATRVSLSLLSQAIFAALLAAVFIGEKITPVQIFGSIIILAGIATTFYEKTKPNAT
ncbi:DMT family transporter [Chryseobacterium sp. HSC-36S06]|uniref:DMT family transporter n=1 Tax=Chryseobacterium sp. HSC-36S06 TaxID=2910970 RepID=UPI00209C8CE6|nr:DMT family transporter [Chryseobacterium sp. HSC-36S06]MCP2037568.1 drug/metabolite transporter (DMT)-like permease [Chryseobacterium sp. HSC-36S06]